MPMRSRLYWNTRPIKFGNGGLQNTQASLLLWLTIAVCWEEISEAIFIKDHRILPLMTLGACIPVCCLHLPCSILAVLPYARSLHRTTPMKPPTRNLAVTLHYALSMYHMCRWGLEGIYAKAPEISRNRLYLSCCWVWTGPGVPGGPSQCMLSQLQCLASGGWRLPVDGSIVLLLTDKSYLSVSYNTLHLLLDSQGTPIKKNEQCLDPDRPENMSSGVHGEHSLSIMWTVCILTKGLIAGITTGL